MLISKQESRIGFLHDSEQIADYSWNNNELLQGCFGAEFVLRDSLTATH